MPRIASADGANAIDTPCLRCVSRRQECVYPTREKLITIPESYVRNLEKQVELARRPSACLQPKIASPIPHAIPIAVPPPPQSLSVSKHESMESSSPEGFVQKLKALSSSPAQDGPAAYSPTEGGSEREGRYTYSRLRFDLFRMYT